MIRIKRVYEPRSRGDGHRILVDRLWPRGLSKEVANIEFWAKDIAPSNELRQWYGHEPEKWTEFRKRYFAELAKKADNVETVIEYARSGTVTFLYSSKEDRLNNAVALKEYVEKLLK